MKRKIKLEFFATEHQLQAARECAKRNGEKSLTAMLRNFVETEMRNYVHDDEQFWKKSTSRR